MDIDTWILLSVAGPFLLNHALVMVPRVALPLMPVIFESAAEHDTGLKRPVPFFFCAAAFFLPAAWVARVGESSEPCVEQRPPKK